MSGGCARLFVTCIMALTLACECAQVIAADLRVSAFGTAGYAVSSSDLTYLRHIDDRGTVKADSLLGVQAEVQFDPHWGLTAQVVTGASRKRDDGLEVDLRWAFASFRPSNDWLIRAGRVRPPIFFHTQNAEVGVTYDQVRLPAEVYGTSPVYDLDGLAISKTWLTAAGSEINAEVYRGKSDVAYRFHYQRDPPERYFPERITVTGLVLSHQTGALMLRAGAHHAKLTAKGPGSFPRSLEEASVPAPPPFGGTVYLPGREVRRIDVHVLTFGVDWRPNPWRITAEYAQRETPDSNLLVNDRSAYVTIAREMNRWTPYVTYARMLTRPEERDLYRKVRDAPVPLLAQGAPSFLPDNFHRVFSDGISLFDQSSLMLGVAYSFGATSKLKLEWMRTRVGLTSSYVDGESRDRKLDVFSIAYSFGF